MEEVLKKLQAVSNDLATLKWEEELKKDQADKIDKNITSMNNEIESAISNGNFTKDGLDKVVEGLGNTNTKVETGFAKIDIAKESIDSQLRKSKIKHDIKSKYDTLFKQKEVIDEYVEKYDPNNIIDIKNGEIERNNKEIEIKKELNSKIQNFIATPEVTSAINNINEIKKKNEQLEKAKKAVKNIKDIESKASTPGLADELIEKYKEVIVKKKNDLKEILKDTGVSYSDDMSIIESAINAKKVDNNAKKQDSANKIRALLGATGDVDLINTFGDLTVKTPEEIVDILKRSQTKVQGQISKLNENSTRLKNAVDQMEKDMNVEDIDLNNISSDYPPTSYVPSDDEIENDPDYQAQISSMVIPADRKDKIAARREYLMDKAGISKDDEGAHPIIWFKSHFGREKLDNEMIEFNKSELKEKIKQKLIKAKQKEEHSNKVKTQTRKNKFKEQYEVTVVNEVLKGETDEDVVRGTAYQNAADEMDRD